MSGQGPKTIDQIAHDVERMDWGDPEIVEAVIAYLLKEIRKAGHRTDIPVTFVVDSPCPTPAGHPV